MDSTLKRTPLFEEHLSAGGKLVPFAGYEMPVQYPSGITTEHHAVRRAAGLFDVSHMGEFELRGADALALIQHVTSNDASRLEVGQAQYSTLMQADGTVLDDLIVYRMADRYMLVVNASGRERDLAHIRDHAHGMEVELSDISDAIGLLALQGPHAEPILAQLTPEELPSIGYYRFREGEVEGRRAVISRTGYTGEDGFELYVAAADAAPLWRRLLEVGAEAGLIPAGLGARDSLRLEMGYVLYGSDLDERYTPLEAGLGWVTKLDKGPFLGHEHLREQKAAGVSKRLAGFRLAERGFPRHGYELRVNGEPAGEVTSGTLSPSLGAGIGLGYLPPDATKPGTAIEVMIRGQPVPAEVIRPPFYREGSVRSASAPAAPATAKARQPRSA